MSERVTHLSSRRADPAAQPAEGPPDIEMFMDDDRIKFRDQKVLDEYVREARAEGWDEGWKAAQEVVELDGVKCWAHTVLPDGYEGNPHRTASHTPPTDAAEAAGGADHG